MQTLTYLNGVGSTQVAFTDSRPSGVVFDRPRGKDYEFTETQLTFNLLVGAEIVEIINPTQANVRYKINLGAVSGVTLNFGTLPLGITVSQNGSIYTFYGIDSVADWNLIKAPQVVIDPTFAGSFSYSGAVVYNTDTAADIEFEWNVGIYHPTAQLTAESTVNCTPTYVRGATCNMISFSSLATEVFKTLGAEFAVAVDPNFTAGLTRNFNNTFSVVAKPKQWTFTDTSTAIDAPYTDDRGFGSQLAIDSTGLYGIGGVSTGDYVAHVFQTGTGNIEFSCDRQQSSGFSGSSLIAYSPNYFTVVEGMSDGDQYMYLWQKKSTGDLYQVTGSPIYRNDPDGAGGVGISYATGHNTSCMTDTHLIVRDIFFDPNGFGQYGGKVFVYSIDTTTGLSELYTHEGPTDTDNYGSVIALNDTYYVFARRNGSTGNDIYIYTISTGALYHTHNTAGSTKRPVSLAMDGNNLIILYDDDDYESFNITTKTSNYVRTLSNGPGGTNHIRKLDTTYTAFGDTLYNVDNGKQISDLNASPLLFKDTTTMLEGDSGYLVSGQTKGRVYIRRET